jgi:hypothetical protein
MPSDGESRELRCLTAITEGRLYFCEKLVHHGALHFNPSDPHRQINDIIPILRGDNAYHIAEFFYLLEELDLYDPAKLTMLIDRQNSDMKNLYSDRSRMSVIGLNPQRVKDAIFSDDQQKKIFLDNGLDEHGKVQLDQSDLGKFMAIFMSAESCRQAVLALSDCGFLNRRGHGTVLVSSAGTLEYYFREHLAKIDAHIRGEEFSPVS